jgi:hypothetical protein
MKKFFALWSTLVLSALLAALMVAAPAQAAGGVRGGGGAARPIGNGGGGNNAGGQSGAAGTLLPMTANLAGPGGVGFVTVVKSPNPALSGVVDAIPLPIGTSVDLLINGTKVATAQVQAGVSQQALGTNQVGAIFQVTRVTGKASNQPIIDLLGAVGPGATAVVQASATGQVLASGTFFVN